MGLLDKCKILFFLSPTLFLKISTLNQFNVAPKLMLTMSPLKYETYYHISCHLSQRYNSEASKTFRCQTIIELCAPQHHNNYRKIIIHLTFEIIHRAKLFLSGIREWIRFSGWFSSYFADISYFMMGIFISQKVVQINTERWANCNRIIAFSIGKSLWNIFPWKTI